VINNLEKHSLILFRIFGLVVIFLSYSSFFAISENISRIIDDNKDNFSSAVASNPQIVCSTPRLNLLEIIKPKKAQPYPAKIFSALFKSPYPPQTPTHNCHLDFNYTYGVFRQQMFLLSDLPPPSLLQAETIL
jgi:hypothetical protein